MSDEKVALTVLVYPGVKDTLSDEAFRQGFITGGRGSVSKLINHIADRLQRGASPFRHETFNDSVFTSLYEVAEVLVTDCSLGEGDVVRILRSVSLRRFDGITGPDLGDIIMDIQAILF